jgi:hypothetical protein
MALPASDEFLQGGADQGLTAYSANWSYANGTFIVPTSVGYVRPASVATDSIAYWNADAFDPDQVSQIVTAAGWAATGLFVGPAVRCSAGAGYAIEANGSEWYLGRMIGGVWSTIANGLRTFADADVMRLEVTGIGATVTLVFKHATAAAPTTFTTVTTFGDTAGTRILSGGAGISGYDSGSVPAIGRWDANNLAGAPPSTMVAIVNMMGL